MIEILVCAGAAALAALAWGVVWQRRRFDRHGAPTFVFADLVGYTRVTAQRGDEAAADLAREFRRTMCALSREHGARQVKSMGDGVMIWAPDPEAGVAIAEAAVNIVGRRPSLLPTRVGVHTGPAVRRGCDWYGNSVNVAARLASMAEPNEALISGTTRAAAHDTLAAKLDTRRDLSVRGVDQPVATWRLT
jgi:adenylate cyclase